MNDHDLLLQVSTDVKNGSQQLKDHKEVFDQHVQDDKENFKEILIAIKALERIIWIAAGVVIAFEALPRISGLIGTISKLGGH